MWYTYIPKDLYINIIKSWSSKNRKNLSKDAANIAWKMGVDKLDWDWYSPKNKSLIIKIKGWNKNVNVYFIYKKGPRDWEIEEVIFNYKNIYTKGGRLNSFPLLIPESKNWRYKDFINFINSRTSRVIEWVKNNKIFHSVPFLLQYKTQDKLDPENLFKNIYQNINPFNYLIYSKNEKRIVSYTEEGRLKEYKIQGDLSSILNTKNSILDITSNFVETIKLLNQAAEAPKEIIFHLKYKNKIITPDRKLLKNQWCSISL